MRSSDPWAQSSPWPFLSRSGARSHREGPTAHTRAWGAAEPGSGDSGTLEPQPRQMAQDKSPAPPVPPVPGDISGSLAHEGQSQKYISYAGHLPWPGWARAARPRHGRCGAQSSARDPSPPPQVPSPPPRVPSPPPQVPSPRPQSSPRDPQAFPRPRCPARALGRGSCTSARDQEPEGNKRSRSSTTKRQK